MFGANLVIPAQICDELSCRQDKVYGRTDTGNSIALRPERPRGKNGTHHKFSCFVDAFQHSSCRNVSPSFSQKQTKSMEDLQ